IPAAPRAPAAAPPRSCLRVSRTGGLRGRPDQIQPSHPPVPGWKHPGKGEGSRNVLADGVEGAVAPPEVGHVPLVGIAGDCVDRHVLAADAPRPLRVAEARHGASYGLSAGGLDVDAARDARPAGIAAEIHVPVTPSGLMPKEHAQEAAVPSDDWA